MNPVRSSKNGNGITQPGIKHGSDEKTSRKNISNGVKVLACIPARYGSTRFAGKVLAKETGKFLIQHTWERVCLAKIPDRVIIAADDKRIADAAESFGAECILTSPAHTSGTDRIAEAVKDIDAEIVVNIQADEPEIEPGNIDLVAELLITQNSKLKTQNYGMATLAADFLSKEQIADPNIVKVVISSCEKEKLDSCFRRNDNTQYAVRNTQCEIGRAIYFSRSPIPYDRQNGGIGDVKHYLRHIGIYAYRKDFLLKITALPQSRLEKIEKLEQLRAIENGYQILVGKVKHVCNGIDTPQQYAEFVKRYSKQLGR